MEDRLHAHLVLNAARHRHVCHARLRARAIRDVDHVNARRLEHFRRGDRFGEIETDRRIDLDRNHKHKKD